ncbi:MAG TPA: deoxyribodipyrimidine photo-lyase [Luteibaculaceae bacterium]|nr:deoxyribodipyrimidine photo-lyase [Luteibaculaceae bacterium]
MTESIPYVICWLRRDLRLFDQAALYHALKSGYPVQLLFIFDTEILDKLEDRSDARVHFIHQSLISVNRELEGHGASLRVEVGNPVEVYARLLAQDPQIQGVFTNEDYEPYAIQRDKAVTELLERSGRFFRSYKDHVIFAKEEVVKDDGAPYTVFTPYKNKWLKGLKPFHLKAYPCEKYFGALLKGQNHRIPDLSEIGFTPSSLPLPPATIDEKLIGTYDKTRDIPSIRGTSRLSLHLRFGTVSIRSLATVGGRLNAAWLNELIWRDFYQMIIWHFPHSTSKAFKPAYDRIEWENNPADFKRWMEGKTGYAIVDAGMRELNATGFMHNRVRMITASFLTKHLLIDWRWGEAYFAKKLLDFDLASNVGGWQWAASSGCDAAPYFRVFNPDLQTQKFDPDLKYIKKWVPEFQDLTYRKMIDHNFARNRVLERFKQALKEE